MYYRDLETDKKVKQMFNENQGKSAAARLAKVAEMKRLKKLQKGS